MTADSDVDNLVGAKCALEDLQTNLRGDSVQSDHWLRERVRHLVDVGTVSKKTSEIVDRCLWLGQRLSRAGVCP